MKEADLFDLHIIIIYIKDKAIMIVMINNLYIKDKVMRPIFMTYNHYIYKDKTMMIVMTFIIFIL